MINFHPRNITNLLSLFNCVGKKFRCSCFYVRNGIKIKECNEYFIFEKIIYIYNYQFKINQVSISPSDNFAYFFNLEEKNVPKEKKLKSFLFIINKDNN